jgi:lipopolysaccharide export system permease protein
MWGANFILFWVGLFFLRQAKNDSRILEADLYLIYWDKLVRSLKRKKKQEVTA